MSQTDRQRTLWPHSARRRRTFTSLTPARPSPLYDVYWRFAVERQAVFFRRYRGEPYPWTDDRIITEYKFTNAYRASDRVSQYLIREVIYSGSQEPEEVFFRTMLFKLFNKIETWELLRNEFGEPTYASFNDSAYDSVLTAAMARKQSIYSAAYIMPSGSRKQGSTKKHRSHLQLLRHMMEDEVPARLGTLRTMKAAFELLLSYQMIGEFLAYQYVTDLNYSTLCDYSEMEFVVAGPGASDGILKCFDSLGGLTEAEIIRLVTDRQHLEFERLGLDFETLWGRPLQLIDCQNLFCEISKYSRVSHPHLKGVANRTRIKQKYRPNGKPLPLWYPPKWGINDDIVSHC
jgi:hypothetical protein